MRQLNTAKKNTTHARDNLILITEKLKVNHITIVSENDFSNKGASMWTYTNFTEKFLESYIMN